MYEHWGKVAMSLHTYLFGAYQNLLWGARILDGDQMAAKLLRYLEDWTKSIGKH
jgi:hypothetical protein